MASLVILARLFLSDDEALKGHPVTVEAFDLKQREWRPLIKAVTDDEGVIRVNSDPQLGSQAPPSLALRLVEEGQPVRVLSPGPMLSFQRQGRSLEVHADFGEIEWLGPVSFRRVDTPGEKRDTVAGLARKRGLRQASILRHTSVDTDPAGFVTRDVLQTNTALLANARTRINLDPQITAELQTLRAVNLQNIDLLAEKDRVIANRDQELRLKTNELERVVAEKERVITSRDLELNQKTIELDRVLAERERMITNKDRELRLSQDQLQAALDRAAEAESRAAAAGTVSLGRQAEINSVFTNIGSQLSLANTTLIGSSNPFRIGNVRVDLKGALSDDGTIRLGGDGNDGSGVSVEMSPGTEQTKDNEARVPDVTGLTQSAAHRVLRSVGLRLKVATQSAKRGSAIHGQSTRQMPVAGKAVPHGSEVLVVFANVDDA